MLGRGERLTEPIAPPPSMMDKHSPYTFDEAVQRLTPELESTATKLADLPAAACPSGQTVAAVTLHPSYVAKSYYPRALFDELQVEPIGSKEVLIRPEKWTRQGPPETVRSTTIFVKGDLQAFAGLAAKLGQLSPSSTAGKDVVKIESIGPIVDVERVKPIHSDQTNLDLEIVLHTNSSRDSSFILDGFRNYLAELGIDADMERRLYADGLCFMPLQAPRNKLQEIAKYSFLRVVREMPKMRPILRSSPGLSFDVSLPTAEPVDPGISVAVFDGGMPDNTVLEPWVRRHDVPGLGAAEHDNLLHGTAVTGALLFGPLKSGINPDRPYCHVDHYRVLDDQPEDEFTVINRIKDILESSNYSYVNLSLGPDLPIEDDDVNLWTAVLDELFMKKKILATIATGNDGDEDETSGNARIQPPSDAVNALAIGAADSTGDNWRRADYSSYGPGRAPGIIKPDAVCFGGSPNEPFQLIDAFNQSTTTQGVGTSFASPAALRTALGIRAYFGDTLSPIALKTLLLHAAEKGGHERKHCGWGRIPTDFKSIVATSGDSVRVVYQGSLSPAEWINVPIPMPPGALAGMVTIKATLCYFTETDPQDPVNYTKAGMEIRFRPHAGKRKNEGQLYPDSKAFFQKGEFSLFDDELNYNAHFWETTLSASKTMRGSSLSEPVFNLHYNARDGGARVDSTAPSVEYALVVTVQAKRHTDLYQQVSNRYRTQLETMRPIIQIPVNTIVN